MYGFEHISTGWGAKMLGCMFVHWDSLLVKELNMGDNYNETSVSYQVNDKGNTNDSLYMTVNC